MSLAISSPLSCLGELLLPELRSVAPEIRGVAIGRAMTAPFDVPELLALAVAVLGTSSSAAIGIAVAMLVVLRRTRRGMREFASRGAP